MPQTTLFRNPQFLKLWGNQLFLQIGFNMCNYTALLIVAHRTGSPFAQAEFFAALTIPAFLFGFIAGPAIDLVNRKHLMLISDVLLATLFFLYAFTNGNLLGIMAIAFLTSSVARFFVPAQLATIPSVVSREHLEQANSLFLFTLMGTVLVGYALAGPLIQMFGGLGTPGERLPFFVSSASQVIGFLLLLSFHNVHVVQLRRKTQSVVKEIAFLFLQTVHLVRQNKQLLLALLLLVFVELLGGVLSVTVLAYVSRYLHLSLTSVTYIFLIPLMFGLVAGVLSLPFIRKMYGYRKTMVRSVVAVGILLVFLGVLPMFSQSVGVLVLRSVAIATSFLLGAFFVVIAVESRTVLQVSTPGDMQGRIFSFLDILIAVSIPIPVLGFALLADRVSLLMSFWLFGLFIIGSVVVGSRVVGERK